MNTANIHNDFIMIDGFGQLPAKQFSDEYLRLIKADLANARAHRHEMPAEAKRGLTDETLDHFNFGYLEDWILTKSRAQWNCGIYVDKNGEPKKSLPPASRRIIIPTDDGEHFNAVAVPSDRKRMDKKYWKQHAGTKKIFGDKKSVADADIVIVVEGEFDAASIWQCSGGKIAAVAILGCANANNTLMPNLKSLLSGKKLLLLLDGDKSGREASENLRGELIKRGVPAVSRYLTDFNSFAEGTKQLGDKVDCNDLLRKHGNEFLKSLLDRVIDDARADLTKAEKEIAQQDLFNAASHDNDKSEEQNTGTTTAPPVTAETIATARAAIKEIPVAQCTEKDWLTVIWAGKASGLTLEELDKWSRPDKRYDAAKVAYNFNRYDPAKKGKDGKPLTVASLVEIARKFNPEFNPPRKMLQRPCPPELRLTEEQREKLFDGNSSDKACASRLIQLFGNRVRYLQLDDSWLTFNQNIHGGGIWTNGGTKNAVLYPFALELSERLEANATTEHESKLAAAFTSTKKFSSTISMMKSFDSIIIKAEDLDQHPELLNCKNGVVDLESGKFYPTVAPSLLITKQANAVFRGINFRDEHVDKFLTSIQPNADTRAALLRYLGYGCTGLIRDHVLQLWRGDGRNGKSTLILLVRSALGTYAVKLPTTAILDTGREIDPNAPTPALSPLEGARLAICDELPRTAHINAALCKTLSGGDEIVIRKLRAECKTIKPTAKIILNGNFNPSCDDVNDLGLRERIRNMPFNQTFTGNRADPKLTEKLSTDEGRSAMLSILVAEAGAWFSEGLIESAEMVAAKDEYLSSNDFVGEFVETYCEDKREGFIDLKAFVEKLQAKSAEARRTPERLLKDMVKNWFKLKGKDNVQYKQHPRTRRAGFSGIDWSYTAEDFDDLNAFAPPN